jgi:hypothetical protein
MGRGAGWNERRKRMKSTGQALSHSLCFLTIMRWTTLFCCTLLPWCSTSPPPRNNRTSRPRTETVSQNKSFLLLSYFSQVFVIAMKNWLTHHLIVAMWKCWHTATRKAKYANFCVKFPISKCNSCSKCYPSQGKTLADWISSVDINSWLLINSYSFQFPWVREEPEKGGIAPSSSPTSDSSYPRVRARGNSHPLMLSPTISPAPWSPVTSYSVKINVLKTRWEWCRGTIIMIAEAQMPSPLLTRSHY